MPCAVCTYIAAPLSDVSVSANSLCAFWVCHCHAVCYHFIPCVKMSFIEFHSSSVCVCMCMHVSFTVCLCGTHTAPMRVRECLGGHAVDQAPQLSDHSLYQLLFVSVVLPELRKDVVLLTGVLHPANREQIFLTGLITEICKRKLTH